MPSRTEVEWGAYGSRRHTRWSEERLFYIAWTVTAAWGAFHFDQIGPALKVICIVFGFMFLAAVDLLHQLLKTDHRLRSFYSTVPFAVGSGAVALFGMSAEPCAENGGNTLLIVGPLSNAVAAVILGYHIRGTSPERLLDL